MDLDKTKEELNNKLQDVTDSSQLLLAYHNLKKESSAKHKELEKKEKYSLYQEEMAFQKELNILRNDYYYQMINGKDTILINFLYKPLDILSGDAYSVRKICKSTTFYFVVDGMGKGISASLTSILITAFINHTLDIMLKNKTFDFYTLINNAIEYIRPILLEEEAIATDFILIDVKNHIMQYSTFAMPAMLLENSNHEVIKIKSNNPPLSKYQKNINISKLDISDIIKFLFYTDGLVESETTEKGKTYSDFVQNDFLNSFTKDAFAKKAFEKIATQDDDITIIFLNKSSCFEGLVTSQSFESSLENIDMANEWYEKELNNLLDNPKSIYNGTLAFNELFTNAYEHGNLGISSKIKHQLISEDIYYETLMEKEKYCDKEIQVTINKIIHNSDIYVITKIVDEGEGFDTQILSKIFRNTKKYNGRGVFISRQSSSGIFYNSKGNTVLFITH